MYWGNGLAGTRPVKGLRGIAASKTEPDERTKEGAVNRDESGNEQRDRSAEHRAPIVDALWGVRYQVKDVRRSIEFYTSMLGFKLDHQHPPAFGQVSVGNLKLILSGPGASGSRPMPDGASQEPGGWNRVILQVRDLAACIAELTQRGARFRNAMETGPGGRQIQIDDPDGNPIELFEPDPRST